MPSSAPDWRDGLFEDLARDARAAAPSRYEILGLLGEGAAGVVYRARHRELGHAVALKVLRPAVGTSEVARQRFRREAQTAAGLSHPRVVAVHDAGEENGQLYLVMELVEGRPLSEILAGPRPERKELVRILEQAARGVGAAHARGVVHRDLKPANILVTATGEPKVGDFGLAHLVDSSAELTRTGSTLGTPLYMAPEQVEGRSPEISPRTDVYALGAILYEVLAGRPPHTGATPMELYGKILHEEPKAIGAGDLETIAMKALDKQPGRRYADATSFAEDVQRALEGLPIEARPTGAVRRFLRRRKKQVAVAVALALAAGAFAWERSREREQRVGLLRDHVRVSLDAVLKLRRAGANGEMAAFVPGLEAKYREALEGAPDVAEIEYLRGRMHRALLEDEQALGFQERALAKDPAYAPALYERAILKAARYGVELGKAIAEARQLPEGPVTAKAAREQPPAAAGRRESLEQLRESILQDGAALERSLAGGGRRHVTDAHVRTLRGLLAFHRKAYDEARTLLEGVVRDDPLLEEGWHALCSTASRQAGLIESGAENREAALRGFDDAEALWSRAIARDVGYGPHWLGRGLLYRSRGLTFMKRGGEAVAEFRKAEADLGRALELKADPVEVLSRRSNVRHLAGIDLMGKGQDPSADFAGALGDVEEGLARFGGRGEFWVPRAAVLLHRGIWRARRKEDPFPDLAAAEADLEKALALEAWVEAARHSLGSLKMQRAEYRRRRGEDPLPELEAAERDLTEAVRRNREFTSAWASRGSARLEKAQIRAERGADPLEDLGQAEEDFSEALRLLATHAEAWAKRGRVRTRLAGIQEKKGDAAKAAALRAAARADLERGIALNPAFASWYAADLADVRR